MLMFIYIQLQMYDELNCSVLYHRLIYLTAKNKCAKNQ